MKILIKGGTLVTDETIYAGWDLLIEDSRIAQIGPSITAPDAKVINASGKLVFPGGIDSHVHLEYPQGKIYSADDFLSGSVAALHGGTTTLIDFIEATKGETFMEALVKRRQAAEERSTCDFTFHMTVNRADPASLGEIPPIIAQGITSFKMYTAYDGVRLGDEDMERAMGAVAHAGGLTIVHSEDFPTIQRLVAEHRSQGHTDPRYHPICHPIAGEVASNKAIVAMAKRIPGAHTHIVHVSTAEGALLVEGARAGGMDFSGEVCPQYLVIDEGLYVTHPDPSCLVMSPPLRPRENCRPLWEALQRGIGLDMVVTDHCPFTAKQRKGFRTKPDFYLTREGARVAGPADDPWHKDLPSVPPFFCMPGGGAGIEPRVQLIFTYGVQRGPLSLPQFVRATSTAAARRFGLYPRKGCLQPGSDADIVIYDPTVRSVLRAETLHMMSDRCPYEGVEVMGAAEIVIRRGEILIENGRMLNYATKGVFLARDRLTA